VPWADKGMRWTRMFEAFAVRVLKACVTVEAATSILGINWHAADRIIQRAVQRGELRRELGEIEHLGVDEKSFRTGHRYASVLVDGGKGVVIEVVEGRNKKSSKELFSRLPAECRSKVKVVSIDMWEPFLCACLSMVPSAAIVHDRFHISQHMGKAVDQVRKTEHRELFRQGDRSLVGTKYNWLSNPENVSQSHWPRFKQLLGASLKTARAWEYKENLRHFWDAPNEQAGRAFFKHWYGRAIRSQLEPVKKVARMIKNHFSHIVTWFRYPVTNAAAEGLNSRIQTIKASARGFHSFASFRARILFHCGGLDLDPRF